MKKSTILVVDDDLFFRRLCSELLSEDGYHVETFASGDEALVRLRQGGVDIILTDMVMPGMSGLDVLRLARAIDNPPEVILATGNATMETAIQALKSGARDYLIKPFNPEKLRHLIRTALEQRRLLDENALLKSQIRLFQKGKNLSSILEIERLLPEAVQTLLAEVGKGRGFAFLIAQDKVSRLLGVHDMEEDQAYALVRFLIHYLRGLVDMRMLRSTDLAPEPDWPEDVRTLCIFPLLCRNRLKGAVVIFNAHDRDFLHPIPQENLVFLSKQANIGFENAYLYQGAQELIYTDDLTGLYNYRYLQEVLDREIMRTERYGLEFSLIFIDLDHFKGINDQHGHLAGSSALKEISGLLYESVREVDLLFRYGGDEFTALLVETDSRGAALVAERIRVAVEDHIFLAGTEMACRLTATVGYATFPENATDKKAIIDLADRAMYYGKQTRNVVRGAWEIMRK